MWLIIVKIACFLFIHETYANPPNIILLIADDLGWNDIGFHGSNEIPTPNIDALAYNGVILNRHYTQPTCTPSRAALLTGKYPIKLGMQGAPISEGSPTSLPMEEKILPQYLKEFGYVSRLIGKWHLGYYKEKCTPIRRGFDSHLGFYNGWVRYNDSINYVDNMSGIDAWENNHPAGNKLFNKYNTDVFSEEAIKIITEHNIEKPLFLDLSYSAVHAVSKYGIQVRNVEETEKKFSYIKDRNRRLLAGALSALDESLGKILKALHNKSMLSNSIILFISDNGGATNDHKGLFQNYASNWPLRGWKSSLVEGGVRGVAALWSPLIQLKNHVSDKLIHLTDWLPTFYAAAGGNITNLQNLDGKNFWPFFTGKVNKTPRKEALINIDEVKGDEAIIDGNWKLIKSVKGSVNYAGVSGRDEFYKYNMTSVLTSLTHRIIHFYKKANVNSTVHVKTKTLFWRIRNRAKIDKHCKDRINRTDDITNAKLECFQKGCLFNLKNDHCEYNDFSSENQEKFEKMKAKLDYYRKQMVHQQINKLDVNSDPKNFNNYWSPWVKDDD